MNNVRRPLLNRRLEGPGTTIFAEMSARAVATGSINLGQGFPDRDGPPEIVRFAFCKRPEVLTEALARLKTFLT